MIFSLLSLALFAVLTYIVKLDRLTSFDFTMMVKIQDHTPPAFNGVLSFFSTLGSFHVLTLLFIMVLLLRKRVSGWIVFLLYGAGHLVELFLKIVLHQPGPPFLFFRGDTAAILPDLYTIPGSSYPSGHSFRAFFLLTVFICMILRGKKFSRNVQLVLIACAVFFAVVIAFSKIALGEHWPTDVIAGGLLGLSFSIFTILLHVY